MITDQKCGDALWLESKGGMAHSIRGYTCGWQVKLRDPSLTVNTRHSERFRDEFS